MAVKLLEILYGTTDFNKAILKLEALGNATDGPLRVTYKGGVPRLHVRKWGEFLQQLFFGDDLTMRHREKETADAIEKFTHAYIQSTPIESSPENSQIQKAKMRQAMFKLRAKVSGVDFNAKPNWFENIISATTMPAYKNGETLSANVKPFRGKFLVPPGLSMGVIDADNVLADYRLGGHLFRPKDKFQYGTIVECSAPCDEDDLTEDEYYFNYQRLLNNVKDENKSVVINLVYFKTTRHKTRNAPISAFSAPIQGRRTNKSSIVYEQLDISENHRNGAWHAASEFVAKRKKLDEPTSVLICLDKLPRPASRPQKRLELQDTGASKIANYGGPHYRDSTGVLDYRSDHE